MTETSLEKIFALIPATMNRYLAFTRAILLSVLRYIPEGAIRWPCDREFNELSLLIQVSMTIYCFLISLTFFQARHPLLNGAFGGINGLNLPVQTADDPMIENVTFNGWLHTHCISGVFVFSPKGMYFIAGAFRSIQRLYFLSELIILCNLNAPGSWHDAHVARPIFNQLRDETPEGYYLVADTAFPRGAADIAGAIKAPIKQGQQLPEDPQEYCAAISFNRELLSYRQTAEWGMRGLQGSFGRLRLPLNINDDEGRGDFLEICARMNNVRASLVGINQI